SCVKPAVTRNTFKYAPNDPGAPILINRSSYSVVVRGTYGFRAGVVGGPPFARRPHSTYGQRIELRGSRRAASERRVSSRAFVDRNRGRRPGHRPGGGAASVPLLSNIFWWQRTRLVSQDCSPHLLRPLRPRREADGRRVRRREARRSAAHTRDLAAARGECVARRGRDERIADAISRAARASRAGRAVVSGSGGRPSYPDRNRDVGAFARAPGVASCPHRRVGPTVFFRLRSALVYHIVCPPIAGTA